MIEEALHLANFCLLIMTCNSSLSNDCFLKFSLHVCHSIIGFNLSDPLCFQL